MEFDFTLFVLFGLWGAVTAILKVIEMMNERREKILDANSNLTICHRQLILTSDWRPIRQITFLFIYLVALLFILSALMHMAKHGWLADVVVVAESVLAVIIGVAIIIAARWGSPGFDRDDEMMKAHLIKLKDSIVGKWQHAEGGILDFQETELGDKSSYKALVYIPSHWRHKGDKTVPSSDAKMGRYKVIDYKPFEISRFGDNEREESECVTYEITSAGKLILSGGCSWKFDKTEFTKR